jgi:hypothetical protein
MLSKWYLFFSFSGQNFVLTPHPPIPQKKLTSSMETYHLENLTVALLVKFSVIYGTRRLITLSANTRHWPLSWATWIFQTLPSYLLHPLFLHLRLDLPSVISSSGISTTVLHALQQIHILTSCWRAVTVWGTRLSTLLRRSVGRYAVSGLKVLQFPSHGNSSSPGLRRVHTVVTEHSTSRRSGDRYKRSGYRSVCRLTVSVALPAAFTRLPLCSLH